MKIFDEKPQKHSTFLPIFQWNDIKMITMKENFYEIILTFPTNTHILKKYSHDLHTHTLYICDYKIMLPFEKRLWEKYHENMMIFWVCNSKFDMAFVSNQLLYWECWNNAINVSDITKKKNAINLFNMKQLKYEFSRGRKIFVLSKERIQTLKSCLIYKYICMS